MKAVSCPKIVSTYNESMGSVDLADMLIVLYRIDVKTRHWYIKVFWQFVDVANINAWILYKRHYKQLALSANKRKTLAEFTSSIVSALILAGKSKPNSFRGWPTKRASIEPTWNGGKKPTLPIPIDDVRHDEVGHWPKPGIDKKRCCVRTTVGSPVQTAMFTSVWLRIVTAMCISTVNKSGLWIFLLCNVYLSYFVKMLFSH